MDRSDAEQRMLELEITIDFSQYERGWPHRRGDETVVPSRPSVTIFE